MLSTIQLENKAITNTGSSIMDLLFEKLDEAIDDIEQGRVQTLDEAWQDIDSI